MTLNKDKISAKLLQWYRQNKRVLPWRGSGDPYKIWLSEIIMQQTRVAQGTPYYLKFIEKFPEINALARAEEHEILKLWQGLGYYSRARNLHKAAKKVVDDYQGRFPEEYHNIITLNGIGPYTAAAIASIAFNKPYAVVDGNVYRVLARLFGISMSINAKNSVAFFQKLAIGLLDVNNPGTHNEAIMELGALVCLPQNPLCNSCPLQKNCVAFKNDSQSLLPVITKPKPIRTRYFHYLLVKDGDYFYLNHRKKGDIWQGMYDLPMVENDSNLPLIEEHAETFLKSRVNWFRPIKKITHKLTHQRLEITFYEIGAENLHPEIKKGLVATKASEYNQYPLPKPIELFLIDYLCNPNFL